MNSEVTHEVNNKPKRTRERKRPIELIGLESPIFKWLLGEARANERTLEGQVRYIVRKAYDVREVKNDAPD